MPTLSRTQLLTSLLIACLVFGSWMIAVSGDAASPSTKLASPESSSTTFKLARRGANARPVVGKLEESVSVKDFGATGDGHTDDTAALQAALDSGAQRVTIPEGVYMTSGIEIMATSPLTTLQGEGRPTIKLISSPNRVAITCQKPQFLNLSDFILESSGNKDDGHATVGILAVSKSYYSLSNIHLANFSAHGLQVKQCVYWGLENITVNGCRYGISFEVHNNLPCSTVTLSRAYISGCTRGLSLESSVMVALDNCVFEYCGSSTTNDGALHFAGGSANITQLYFEANYRNIYATDAAIIVNGLYELKAEAPNVVTFHGTAFDRRGALQLDHYRIGAARIGPDELTGRDLTIGTNLVAPLAGGSVRWGDTTKETLTGAVTAGTWTTIKAIPAEEMTGAVNSRAHYEYAISAGAADLGTGFDSGTILNGVLRSHSGALPDWLRLHESKDIQIKLDSTSYGLTYKIVLTRVCPGGP